jgi:putative transposase
MAFATDGGFEMARRRHKPEEIVAKLRQLGVLMAQGRAAAEAVRTKA